MKVIGHRPAGAHWYKPLGEWRNTFRSPTGLSGTAGFPAGRIADFPIGNGRLFQAQEICDILRVWKPAIPPVKKPAVQRRRPPDDAHAHPAVLCSTAGFPAGRIADFPIGNGWLFQAQEICDILGLANRQYTRKRQDVMLNIRLPFVRRGCGTTPRPVLRAGT